MQAKLDKVWDRIRQEMNTTRRRGVRINKRAIAIAMAGPGKTVPAALIWADLSKRAQAGVAVPAKHTPIATKAQQDARILRAQELGVTGRATMDERVRV